MGEITDYLKKSTEKAIKAGVEKEFIVIDPGIGFGKTAEDNYKIMKNLSELKALGMPIMIGTSRKSFLGHVLGNPQKDRLSATVASVSIAALNGADIVRVHDVNYIKDALQITDAVKNS